MDYLIQISKEDLELLLRKVIENCLADLRNRDNEQNTKDEKLLTIPEATAWLRISRATFYKMLKGGGIQTVKIGRKRFVTTEQLSQFQNMTKV